MYSQKRGTKVRFFESYLDPRTMTRKTLSITMDRDTTRTRKEAKRKLDLRASLLYSRPLPQLSFEELCELYLKKKQKEFEQHTYREQSLISLKSSLRQLCDVVVSDTLLTKLEPESIQRLIMEERGATVKTQNNRIKLTKTVIKFAYENGLIDKNFAGALQYIKKTESEKFDINPKLRFLEQEEIKKLLSVIDNQPEKDLTEFLLLSGCRIGEALGLEEASIDFQSDKIHIIQTYGAGSHKMGNPKRPASKRSIYMQPELKLLLENVLKRNKEVREKVFDKGSRVFIDDVSALPIIYEHYYRHLSKFALKAKINKPVTPHTLRRTHASILYGNGIPKEQIAARLGHQPGSEDKITMSVYVYINQQREQAEKEAIQKIKFL